MFQKSLDSCALDETSLSIGRVESTLALGKNTCYPANPYNQAYFKLHCVIVSNNGKAIFVSFAVSITCSVFLVPYAPQSDVSFPFIYICLYIQEVTC